MGPSIVAWVDSNRALNNFVSNFESDFRSNFAWVWCEGTLASVTKMFDKKSKKNIPIKMIKKNIL
jgi:hypothetical protein